MISITDGQIFLEADLFNQGVRPAINVGNSVSRVGGSAQIKAMRQVAGTLRLDLAQYRELAAFAQFASDLDATTRKQLDRGSRIMEIMKQPQYSPMSVAQMAVSLFAVNEGFLDEVPVNKIRAFEDALQAYMKSSQAALMDKINATPEYSDDVAKALRQALEDFKAHNVW